MSAQVIENRFWQHDSGRRASMYGAVPYYNAMEAMAWHTVKDGYSISWPDGTVGVIPMGRGPFKTREEAAACIAANPNFKGFQQD